MFKLNLAPACSALFLAMCDNQSNLRHSIHLLLLCGACSAVLRFPESKFGLLYCLSLESAL